MVVGSRPAARTSAMNNRKCRKRKQAPQQTRIGGAYFGAFAGLWSALAMTCLLLLLRDTREASDQHHYW
jgi:hypothetical protein